MRNMVTLTRICSVGYLNAEPLIWGLSERRAEGLVIERATPADCVTRLASGRVDVGLVPVAAHQEAWRVVPNVSIACDGKTQSVLLLGYVPAQEMKRVALDSSSRTAAMLARLLFRERFMAEPVFETLPFETAAFDSSLDGILVIGDMALSLFFRDSYAKADPPFTVAYDLGAEWKALTNLPFVFAFWAGRPDLPSSVSRALQNASMEGLQNVNAIAERHAKVHSHKSDFYRRYLTEALHYDFARKEMEGLAAFYRMAHAAGLLPRVPVVEFYDI